MESLPKVSTRGIIYLTVKPKPNVVKPIGTRLLSPETVTTVLTVVSTKMANKMEIVRVKVAVVVAKVASNRIVMVGHPVVLASPTET